MMNNIEDDDVNLGLGMSFTKFGIRTRVLSTSGAGVNADSRLNLAFPASDPLSELVWSPHNGLSLKRANSRAADNKPFLVWNVGPSSAEGLSPLQSIRLKQSGDDAVVDQAVLHADDMIIEKVTCLEDSESRHAPDLDGSKSDRIVEKEADKKDAIHEENCIVDQEANSCHLQNVQTDGIAEAAQELAERSLNLYYPLPYLQTQKEGSKEETSDVIPATLLKKLESFAENDLCHLTQKEDCSLREKDLPAEGSPMSSRNCLHRETGKERALSDGDIYGRSLDDEDESVESSNSDGLSSKGVKGKKRQICDEGVIFESKRMIKQIHGSSHGISPSVTRHDSSFLNWITNMTKVSPPSKNCHESESLTCFKPQEESTSISMGFQTIFQSLYCRETDVLNAGGKKIAVSVEESRECAVDDKKLPENLHVSCKSSEQTILSCSKEVNPIVASKPCLLSPNVDPFLYTSKELVSPDFPVAMSDVLEESDPLTSFWITRLSTKTPRSEKGKEIAEETNRCSTPCTKAELESRTNVVFPMEQKSSGTRYESADSKFNAPTKESRNFIINPEASLEVKSISKLCPILPSAMASVFARRLDALRHITSECPNVTKLELEDLLLKLKTLDRVEESSCLCIRCSRSDHLAISCPSLVGHLQLFDGEREDHKLVAGADIATLHNTVAQSEIFHAIRNLRLTRADILRWMNSNVSLSHLNGFYLRVRLGKPEAGLGGSSYHVACITGDAQDNDGCMSKKSILVDVGGITSAVSSQYVSNHDFLEDEIKAWWWRTVDSGCRIPSLVELNSKLNDRKLLGF